MNKSDLSLSRCKLLIVDDDREFTDDMVGYLGSDFDVCVAHDGATAIDQIRLLRPEVVLLDIALGIGADGFEVLGRIRAMHEPPETIMLTGRQDTDTIVESIKAGAFHYVSKPPVLGELINLVNLAAAKVYRVRRLAALESHVQRLGGDLVIRDPAMLRIMKDLDRVGPTNSTVMIVGESGTGKELVARHIHEISDRGKGPFVAVNCGAVSDQLIGSELFGHVRGAFTGAHRDRDGYFARAQGGTIFLDEIGLAPFDLQARLLRVLESHEYNKVGSTDIETTDARVIVASSRDLKDIVDAGEFREELYYRLNVFGVRIPPLRNRPGDIIPLAEHFLGVYSAQMGRRDLSFTEEARDFLTSQTWRGNVRELRNMVERAIIIVDQGPIDVHDLAARSDDWPDELPGYDEAKSAVLRDFQLKYFSRLIAQTDGNVTEAASRCGIARETLSRLLGELGLR